MTRTGSWFLAFALLTWTLCFLVLRHLVTWVPFAFVGLALAIVAVSQRVVPRWLLRPSIGSVTLGLASGALMVVATHLAYRGVVAFAPPVAGATRQLLALLNVVGFSPLVRALLIVLIASCEEVLFRGLMPSFDDAGSVVPHWPSSREVGPVLALAAVYALTTLPLGSGLLLLCAFACGSLWGLMRVATGSLVVPLLAHVLWDLGVMLVWPLPAYGA